MEARMKINGEAVRAHLPPFVAEWRMQLQGATLMSKTLRVLGVGILVVFALLVLLVVLFNVLSGFIPRT